MSIYSKVAPCIHAKLKVWRYGVISCLQMDLQHSPMWKSIVHNYVKQFFLPANLSDVRGIIQSACKYIFFPLRFLYDQNHSRPSHDSLCCTWKKQNKRLLSHLINARDRGLLLRLLWISFASSNYTSCGGEVNAPCTWTRVCTLGTQWAVLGANHTCTTTWIMHEKKWLIILSISRHKQICSLLLDPNINNISYCPGNSHTVWSTCICGISKSPWGGVRNTLLTMQTSALPCISTFLSLIHVCHSVDLLSHK